MHQLTPGQGASLIAGLDDETAADTMEEIDTDLQRDILANLPPERGGNYFARNGTGRNRRPPRTLPEERSQELLRLINPEESEDVQELLEYEADTAGGLMTTAYVALNQDAYSRGSVGDRAQ